MRYYFHVRDGSDHRDDQGTELPDLQAARDHAVRYFGDLLRHAPPKFWNGEQWLMEVTGEDGLVLFSLHSFGIDAPALAGKSGLVIAT